MSLNYVACKQLRDLLLKILFSTELRAIPWHKHPWSTVVVLRLAWYSCYHYWKLQVNRVVVSLYWKSAKNIITEINRVSYLIQSARKRAHLCAMLLPASKKHIRTISVSRVRVFTSRPSFPSRKLKKQLQHISLVCENCHSGSSVWLRYLRWYCLISCAGALVLPAGPIGENPGQPAQNVQDEALGMLCGRAALCPPTQCV